MQFSTVLSAHAHYGKLHELKLVDLRTDICLERGIKQIGSENENNERARYRVWLFFLFIDNELQA